MKNVLKVQHVLFAVSILAVVGSFTSCTKNNSGNPTASGLKPDSAGAGNVLTLTGSGLANMRSIVFDKKNVPAVFNPNFNTDGAVIFRVPDTVSGGPQNIIFTNADGKKLSVPFNVIAIPTINSTTSYSFRAGESITFTGTNLDNINKVVLQGTTTAVTFVAKDRNTLMVTMPASTASTVKITATNSSGSANSPDLVNADQAFVFFRENYENGEQDQNWGNPTYISTTEHISGSASFGTTYDNGQWHQFGFGWNNISKSGYNYLSFWMKGGSVDYPLWISTNSSVSGFASFEDANKINVSANKWTYYKLSLATLDLWGTGPTFNQIGWRIQGPNGQDEKFYLDDVMFIK